jgi:phage terminase small subunit
MSEKRLTVKQRKFLKFYLQTGNASESALKAGYSFRESAFELLSNPIIQKAYQALLDKQGITDDKLNQVLEDGLDATKVVGYLHQYKKNGKNGKVEKVQPDEIISSEFLDVPDLPTRHKYLETALKLKDRLNSKVEHSGEIKGGETKIIIIRSEDKKETKRDGTKSKTKAFSR